MAIKAKNILKGWFSRYLKPTQEQFWDWMDSYWHKDELIPMEKVDGLDNALQGVATTQYVDNVLQNIQGGTYGTWEREYFTNVTGTTITPTIAISSTPSEANLKVYRNGVLQFLGYNFEIVNGNLVFPILGQTALENEFIYLESKV